MKQENISIRPALAVDAQEVQKLRKQGWQDNYVHEETGVTKELLINDIAKLPVEEKNIVWYQQTLRKPLNHEKNLVAVLHDKIIGTVFYDTLENGHGDIGVFVDRDFRGMNIGSMLLEALIARTASNLEVTIFAKNRSRGLYKKYGFEESGPEEKHYFKDNIYLPVQKLLLKRDLNSDSN